MIMNTLELFVFIIFLYFFSPFSCQPSNSSGGPGVSSCTYFGSLDTMCKSKVVPVDKLPKECTSFFFDGLSIDSAFYIYDSYSDSDEEHLKLLAKSSSIDLYVYYGRKSYTDWHKALDKEGKNAAEEAKSLIDYLKTTRITGLVLKNIDVVKGEHYDNDFSELLTRYIDVIKRAIPQLKIAVFLPATHLELYGDCTKNKMQWLDFKQLKPVVDFYVIGFQDLNECSEKYREGGIVPLDEKPGLSLAKIKCALRTAKIPKDKRYFEFSTAPKYKKETPFCDLTYSSGHFAKRYGAGFIATSVDLNDPDGKDCNCGKPYPSFYYLLDGWNDIDAHDNNCEKFDRHHP